MVEKPLTHSRRKVNPNLEKMKPELRQLEEQYVTIIHFWHMISFRCRFTIYNFTNMKRMSYYPLNQPVTGLVTESDDIDRTCIQSVTGTSTIIPTATIVERSEAGTPILESTDYPYLPPIPHLSKGYGASWTYMITMKTPSHHVSLTNVVTFTHFLIALLSLYQHNRISHLFGHIFNIS